MAITDKEITEKIIDIFKIATMGVCISDLLNLFSTLGIEKEKIQKEFEELEKKKIIKKIPVEESFSRKESYFIFNSNEKIKLQIELEEIISFNKEIEIKQFHTSLNFKEIQIFAGIKPLKAKGIQRLKESLWVKTIIEGIRKSPYPIFYNSLLVYINKKEIYKLTDTEIILDVNRYQSDFKKPGWLVDGQQRCWALHYLFLENEILKNVEISELDNFMKIKLPIILIVADFEKNSEDERQFLSFAFKVANSSKNLPKTFIGEILVALDEKYILDDKEKIDKYISTIRNLLDLKEESPFHDLIILESKTSLEKSFIKGSVIYSVLKSIFDSYKKSEFIHNEDDFYQLIIDYYNIAKTVFNEDWKLSLDSKGNENWLLTRFGLGSLALILPTILPRSLLKSSDRNDLIKNALEKIEDNWDAIAKQNEGFTNSSPDTKKYSEFLSLIIEQT